MSYPLFRGSRVKKSSRRVVNLFTQQSSHQHGIASAVLQQLNEGRNISLIQSESFYSISIFSLPSLHWLWLKGQLIGIRRPFSYEKYPRCLFIYSYVPSLIQQYDSHCLSCHEQFLTNVGFTLLYITFSNLEMYPGFEGAKLAAQAEITPCSGLLNLGSGTLTLCSG